MAERPRRCPDRAERRRARQRVNSARYRLRHPKRGEHKAVLRTAIGIERIRQLMLAEGLTVGDSHAEIEAAWATFSDLIAYIEAGKIYRHR